MGLDAALVKLQSCSEARKGATEAFWGGAVHSEPGQAVGPTHQWRSRANPHAEHERACTQGRAPACTLPRSAAPGSTPHSQPMPDAMTPDA